MKFCYNTNFTLPIQSQRSRSILQDGSRSLGLFWKEKKLQKNTFEFFIHDVQSNFNASNTFGTLKISSRQG